jgi:hypothetical protein
VFWPLSLFLALARVSLNLFERLVAVIFRSYLIVGVWPVWPSLFEFFGACLFEKKIESDF